MPGAAAVPPHLEMQLPPAAAEQQQQQPCCSSNSSKQPPLAATEQQLQQQQQQQPCNTLLPLPAQGSNGVAAAAQPCRARQLHLFRLPSNHFVHAPPKGVR